ncbi:MAG: B12-binding domain-containing radical SAM protein [Candidatus Goldbacteria bacterium]|nr:B12-binding domain-containing radical SAM protein [Candidatus Goldiibacteriota bacterium]
MKLKILLINPPRVNGYPVVREERFEHKDIGSVYPPLSLLYMAAILEKNPDYEIKLIDANGFDHSFNYVHNRIVEFSPDVMISRCGFDTQKEDFTIFSVAKDVGAITILRNKIISDVPEIRDEILKKEDVDIFINSEPEAVIEKLIAVLYKSKKDFLASHQPIACLFDKYSKIEDTFFNYLKEVPGISYYFNGHITTTQPAKEIEDLDKLPYPAYHLLPSLKPYHTGVMQPPFALVATTRGCPFACTFCAYGKSKFRERSIDSVIDEIKWLKEKFKIKSFLFFDDTISIKQGRVKQLCERMIKEGLHKLNWVCCTRANLVTFDMLKIMKKAGMKEIAIGIETGSEQIQKNIKKGVSLDSIRQVAKWCKELKIMFYGLAIIGLPGETKETIDETVKFIKEIDPFYTQFCFATPFPNTEIYQYYKSNGFLLTEDWSKYFPLSDQPVIRTEKLTAEELKELRQKAYEKILLRPMYLLRQIRPFDWAWNIRGLVKIIGRILRVIMKKPVR